MIQRKQTIFLVLAVVALLAEFFLDGIWAGPAAESMAWFTPVTTALFGVAIIGAIATIFLYRDRARQRRFVVFLQITTVLGVLALFGGYFVADTLPVINTSALVTSEWFSLLLPIVAYVFFFMARRGIEKDVELIRSVDRLR